MQLKLMYRDPIGATAAPPPACPHAGCGSGRLRLRQTVAKAIRPAHAEQPAAVPAARYTCLDCGRTFRAYPAGVDRGQVPVGVKHLAAALHLLGLSFRDASLALAALGMPLGKSQAQAAAATIIGAARAAGIAPLFARAGLGDGAAWIEADSRKLPLVRVEDEHGRPGLAIVDAGWWMRGEIDRWGRAMLAAIGVEVEIMGDAACPDADGGACCDGGAGPDADGGACCDGGRDAERGWDEAIAVTGGGAEDPRAVAYVPDAWRTRPCGRVGVTPVERGRGVRVRATCVGLGRRLGMAAPPHRLPRLRSAPGRRGARRGEDARHGAAARVGQRTCRRAGGRPLAASWV